LYDQYYKGLKDHVKDEIARLDALDTLNDLIIIAIKIDNHHYERAIERKGHYTGHRNRSKRKYRSDLIELNAAQRTRAKPSKDEIGRRKEKKLCFECGLPGHQAASHRKNRAKKP
jgi:hypothetical protein